MVVEVERTYDVDVPVEDVWAVLSDPVTRARAISVVESYSTNGEEMVWQLSLPIPLIRKTVSVRTRDVTREPPTYVEFVGRSKIMTVTGEHELTPLESGCRVRSQFTVDGKVPGVEKFFERNIDGEIRNLLRMVEGASVTTE